MLIVGINFRYVPEADIFGLRRTKMAVWLLPKLGINLSG